MPDPLRVACVGAGYFAQFHYQSWARLPQVALVGSCDQDLDKAKATGAPAFDDLSAMLRATRPDVLDIILPPAAHADAIRIAMRAGVRTMICQKPFCTSLDEARKVTAEAEAQGVTLVIHENIRFQPWYRRAFEVMTSGVLGEVMQCTFRLRPGDGQGPDAYLARQPYFQKMERFLVHETAVHWIDTFRFLLGEPLAVYADLRRLNPAIAGEDAGVIVFDHANGARAIFDGNRHLDHAAQNARATMGEALIEGTQATLSISGDGRLTLRSFGAQQTQEVLAPTDFDGFGGDCVHALQTHVVGHLDEGTPLENTARSYLRVIEIEEAIYASASQARKVWLD
ncbi:Gfo/Idh/MocA family protein [Primorskyibacter sp. S187A]|uniref:Gfo/Idh/MocA family protein n=1 Tax=Primorskyibacter sp. S187A TaxID=3415130 RepID=UPI003C7DF275